MTVFGKEPEISGNEKFEILGAGFLKSPIADGYAARQFEAFKGFGPDFSNNPGANG